MECLWLVRTNSVNINTSNFKIIHYKIEISLDGQTGAGKTFTMGTADEMGVLPFALQDIFEMKVKSEEEGFLVSISISYIQIYAEKLYDLIDENAVINHHHRQPLQIQLLDRNHALQLLRSAAKHRETCKTNRNSTSSRSHAICTIYSLVTYPVLVNEPTQTVLKSKIDFVDLAGSERFHDLAGSDQKQFKEMTAINKSLTTLGRVVRTDCQSRLLLIIYSHKLLKFDFFSYRLMHWVRIPLTSHLESRLSRAYWRNRWVGTGKLYY